MPLLLLPPLPLLLHSATSATAARARAFIRIRAMSCLGEVTEGGLGGVDHGVQDRWNFFCCTQPESAILMALLPA